MWEAGERKCSKDGMAKRRKRLEDERVRRKSSSRSIRSWERLLAAWLNRESKRGPTLAPETVCDWFSWKRLNSINSTPQFFASSG